MAMQSTNYWSPPSGVTELGGQSEWYRVYFHSAVHGLVMAWLPDEFVMNLRTHWSYLIGGQLPTVINFLGALANAGRVPNTKYLSAKVWTGTDPLTFTLPLKFAASSNSTNEVIQPIKKLMKMALPRSNGGSFTLIPPGPSIASDIFDALSGVGGSIGGSTGASRGNAGDKITLYIGSYIKIDNIYIESIQVSFKGLLDFDGLPMEGVAQLTCATLYAPTVEDIDMQIAPRIESLDTRRNIRTLVP